MAAALEQKTDVSLHSPSSFVYTSGFDFSVTFGHIELCNTVGFSAYFSNCMWTLFIFEMSEQNTGITSAPHLLQILQKTERKKKKV